MRNNPPIWLLKLISISIGLTGGFLILEIFARLAPASNTFSIDLPLRLVWGGAGSLMSASCKNVFEISYRCWQKTIH